MKALVVYSSRTGNTRRLAEAVYERLTCDKELRPVNEAPPPEGYDCVAVGFWLQGGQPDPPSASYLKRAAGVPLFLFATHGASADSDHATNAMNAAAAMAEGSTIVGTFHCQGEVDPAVLEKAGAKNPQPVWLEAAAGAIGHPDAADLAAIQTRLADCMPEATR